MMAWTDCGCVLQIEQYAVDFIQQHRMDPPFALSSNDDDASQPVILGFLLHNSHSSSCSKYADLFQKFCRIKKKQKQKQKKHYIWQVEDCISVLLSSPRDSFVIL